MLPIDKAFLLENFTYIVHNKQINKHFFHIVIYIVPLPIEIVNPQNRCKSFLHSIMYITQKALKSFYTHTQSISYLSILYFNI